MYIKIANTSNYGKLRSVNDIRYIVIHYTGNDGDTARGNCEYFARQALRSPASAHYFVDEKECAISVPINYIAYHCGASAAFRYKHLHCRNTNSIGIELCSRKDKKGNFYFDDRTIENAAKLTAEKMILFDIPLSNLLRHYDITGKNCPAPFVKDSGAWVKFKERVSQIMEGENMKYYENIKEIPAGEMREVVQKMIDKKAIRGTSSGLHLSEDNLRLLVFLARYGVL